MRAYLQLAILAIVQTCLPAAGPVPSWQRLLDEMVARAESDARPPESPPIAQPPSATPVVELPIPVSSFQNYFEGPGRGGYESAIRRLAVPRPVILRIFEEEGIPAELIWVGLVESGFRGTALSPAGALGVWQLMPDTARRFGLRVGAGEEERTDLEKSTRAAARYLRMLHDRFGDWPLALAAYNAGENRVERALRQVSQRSFWSLYDSALLPRETRNYVPAVLAAQKMAQADPHASLSHTSGTGRPDARPGIAFAPIAFAP